MKKKHKHQHSGGEVMELARETAKLGVERVGEAPGEHRAAHPVHDHHQVKKALGHRNVGAVSYTHLTLPTTPYV